MNYKKKKILFFLDSSPYPILDGKSIRTHSFIDALYKRNNLSLICTNINKNVESVVELEKYFKNIWDIQKEIINSENATKNKGAFFKKIETLSFLLTGKPIEIYYYYDELIEEKLIEILENNNFDAVFCRYIDSAKYFIELRKKIKAKVIIDLDDIEPIKIDRYLKANMDFFSLQYWVKALNNVYFSNYHKKLNLVDKCFVCSQQDKKYLEKKNWNKNADVIPNTIDVKKYSEVGFLTEDIFIKKRILFCGKLGYQPNIAGLKWFLKKVWPLIIAKDQKTEFFMVGRDPDEDLLSFVDNKRIFLFPNVESVIPYYEKAAITIVPINIAGGTRIKILEAFACHRPVVSTKIGAEGLDVKDKKHCIIADKPDHFAISCLKLLNEFGLAAELSENAFSFVNENYNLSNNEAKIRKCFDFPFELDE